MYNNVVYKEAKLRFLTSGENVKIMPYQWFTKINKLNKCVVFEKILYIQKKDYSYELGVWTWSKSTLLFSFTSADYNI